jgi:hypothetical protein
LGLKRPDIDTVVEARIHHREQTGELAIVVANRGPTSSPDHEMPVLMPSPDNHRFTNLAI